MTNISDGQQFRVDTSESEEYYKIAMAYHEIIDNVEDLEARPELHKTSGRAAKAMEFFTSGYEQDAALILQGAVFQEEYDDMIVVKDIEFYSLCEHHLLPFFGRAHVGYIPDGNVVGLSKIPRIVNMFARRLQMQERLTNQIADTLSNCLKPKGVAVVIEARHLCKMMRGVQTQMSSTMTNAMRGPFREEASCRQEFMDCIKG